RGTTTPYRSSPTTRTSGRFIIRDKTTSIMRTSPGGAPLRAGVNIAKLPSWWGNERAAPREGRHRNFDPPLAFDSVGFPRSSLPLQHSLKGVLPLVQVRRAPAPAPSAIASSLNCPLCVTRNVTILGRFVFRRHSCGRRRGRYFYRRVILADLSQRCN